MAVEKSNTLFAHHLCSL